MSLRPAASGRRISGCRGFLRRPRTACFVDRTHQADVVAIGIGHDRVARTPEGVEGRLPPRISGGGQLLIALVDSLPGREREPDDDADGRRIGAPARVPKLTPPARPPLPPEAPLRPHLPIRPPRPPALPPP